MPIISQMNLQDMKPSEAYQVLTEKTFAPAPRSHRRAASLLAEVSQCRRYLDENKAFLQGLAPCQSGSYQAYVPIHDARTRETHLALGKLGLDGTGVFRRDDPFWDRFTPPWDYNCRCGTNLLTIEAAARMGVQEAKEWLRSGRPPAEPEYRDQFIPFPNNAGFGQKHGILIA